VRFRGYGDPPGCLPRRGPCFAVARPCPRPPERFFTPGRPWKGDPLRCNLPPSPRRCAMLIHAADPLFAWGRLEDHATLATIRDFLDAVPDQELLDGLRAA